MSNKRKRQKIVTIGGGTGSFVVLSGLKHYPVNITAIVSMADDGGSTGVLRDELGVLPPGDIRQCLVALSESSQIMRKIFNYRFDNGTFGGHSFGNIFLSALEKITGRFDEAVAIASEILKIRGQVVPVTLKNVRLVAHLNSGKKIIGEQYINDADLSNLKKMQVKPKAEINPEALQAIKKADKIIINPGNIFCSIIPNFLIDGMAEALKKSKAKKIYVCNLMTKLEHTHNFKVIDNIIEFEKYIGKDIIDYVIYNKEKPRAELLKKYSRLGEYIIEKGNLDLRPKIKFIGRNLISSKIFHAPKADFLKRTLIRHDPAKLARLIINI